MRAKGWHATLGRLILALLLAAFALPALANGPCHDAPAGASMPHHHHDGSTPDERSTVPHVCIGCIPLASLAARILPPPAAPPVVRHRIASARFDRLAATPPALPPPRGSV